jgi:triosephosphate isomerase (TIM)
MASSRPLLAGNWKMNGTRASLAVITGLRDAVVAGHTRGIDVLICPPFTLVMAAADICSGTDLMVGGQDCDPQPSGAATGEISAEMLRDAGASAVIVGHSERRALGDTDAEVRTKAAAAARAGLYAIICVGETRAERDGGETLRVIGRQIDESVPPDSTAQGIALAYEPVWAIGTGHTPAASGIAEVHDFMRRRLQTLIGGESAGVRLLYGGSVKPDNAGEVWGVENVDGLLVGGASLKEEEFLGIAAAR